MPLLARASRRIRRLNAIDAISSRPYRIFNPLESATHGLSQLILAARMKA